MQSIDDVQRETKGQKAYHPWGRLIRIIHGDDL
jgi:hypothetical protein